MSTMTASIAHPVLGRPRPAHAARPGRPQAPAAVVSAEGRGLRLTRRGRLLLRGLPLMVSAAVLTAAAAFFSGLLLAPAAVSSDRAGASLETVTVMPGDSLWSIATTAAPEADPYQAMSRIAELNSLEGRELEVGTVLFVPAED